MLALTLSSCTRDILPEPPKQEGNIVTISATIRRKPAWHTPTPTLPVAVAHSPGRPTTRSFWQDTTVILILEALSLLSSPEVLTNFRNVDGWRYPTTVYKAYYNSAGAITLDDDGKIYLPLTFGNRHKTEPTQPHISAKKFS